MGATFVSHALRATNEKTARAEVAELQRRLRDEFGSDPYNGTLSNCDLQGVEKTIFDTRRAADDYVMELCEKRDAWLVRIREPGDIIRWIVAGWAPE
jgi:hypothetical protein